jgi:signal peptidase II
MGRVSERGPIAGWIGLALAIWTLDRVTKHLVTQWLRLGEEIPVLPMFSWIRLHNQGAAFSFLSGAGGWQRWVFIVIALAFSVFLIYELRRLRADQWLYAAAFALILGGAWGNLYYRVVEGFVVDFILLHYQRAWFFPAFNVADAAISVGAAVWIALLVHESWQARRHGPDSGHASKDRADG